MILRRLDVLPHGLINNEELLGPDGDKLVDYVSWISERVRRYAPGHYQPTLHIDTYGCIGKLFSQDTQAIVRYLVRLEDAARPYQLQIEAVADYGARAAQVERYAELRLALTRVSCKVRLVVDEWCNTVDDVKAFLDGEAADLIQLKLPDMGTLLDAIEAIQLCKQAGVGSYVGGSCAETDLSARLSVHVALATQAEMMLAKPGMGVDEGHMIVANEQARCMALMGPAVNAKAMTWEDGCSPTSL
jgi:methylaspartate ammonia-lyase